MAHADIIIYGAIAIALLARLWAVLGRRNDEDPQRPNPFAAPAPRAGAETPPPRNAAGDGPMPAFVPLPAPPMSLAGALERVKQLDPSFDEKQFLRDAQNIFSSIVGAFSKGDLSAVQNRLGPAVLPHFQAAIEARSRTGETLENKITRIREAEVTAADVADSRASVTVRFVSEQENILRDAAGKIVSGAPGKPEEITDLWTFARDVKAPGSVWQLAETKS